MVDVGVFPCMQLSGGCAPELLEAQGVDYVAKSSGHFIRVTGQGVWIGSNGALLEWSGAAPHIPRGEEPTGGVTRRLQGREGPGWQTVSAHYSRVRVRELYPGTDVGYYFRDGRFEFDVILKPGADPARARFTFGGNRARVESGGDLVVHGGLVLRKPEAYRTRNARQHYLQHGCDERGGAGHLEAVRDAAPGVLEGSYRIPMARGRSATRTQETRDHLPHPEPGLFLRWYPAPEFPEGRSAQRHHAGYRASDCRPDGTRAGSSRNETRDSWRHVALEALRPDPGYFDDCGGP